GNLWAWLLLQRIDGAWINFMNSVVALFVLPAGLLRWVWWRMNIYGEMICFVAAFPIAYLVWFGGPGWHWLGLPALKDRPYWQAFSGLFGLGLDVPFVVTLLRPPSRRDVRDRFFAKVQPPGWWRPIAPQESRTRPWTGWGDVMTGLYGSGFAVALILGMS